MTAAIGHPTLRLLRNRIGELTLGELSSGEWKILSAEERRLVAGDKRQKTAIPKRPPTGQK
jgi:16S rRNA U516 pseudouridylate synthase RsuA-like enzyme